MASTKKCQNIVNVCAALSEVKMKVVTYVNGIALNGKSK